MPRPLNPSPTLLRMPTYALSLLGREAHDRMAASLPQGLRLGHLAVMGVLADSEPLAQRELAERLRIHPSDMVEIVDDLASRELASRESDPGDRRRNLIRLTAAGRELVRRAVADSRRINAELLGALPADGRRAVEELLRRALEAPAPPSRH